MGNIPHRLLPIALAVLLAVLSFSFSAHAATAADSVCPRSAAGSVVAPPPELHSSAGVLELNLHFRTAVDDAGLTRYCYITDDGLESPTLRVNPGDKLIIHFSNELPASTSMSSMAGMQAVLASSDDPCNAMTMSASSTNLHFHGMNVSPGCHQDEVIHTLLQPGDTFDYTLDIPANEPSGMYWYHPHPHGFSEGQTQGGATGAIIVEGIQNQVSALASLPERTLVLRDQLIPDANMNPSDANMPAWDLSLNFVPVLYPAYAPAIIQTQPSQQEFWRVSNQAADLIYDLEIVVNGSPIPVQVYAIDGVPLSGGPLTETSILLPPGSRVEFVLTTPAVGDTARLITQKWDTGPAGDNDPARTIADIKPSLSAPALAKLPAFHANPSPSVARRFAALDQTTPTIERNLYFSENNSEGEGETEFYITVAGHFPAVFDMNQAPNIVVHQGTVEDWTIQNSATEDHVFHIHQIHFQVLEINGQAVTDPALRDTINIPHWNGAGNFPSVKLRMDFRDSNIIGTFPFHCHILEHEDGGMMGLIQVLPAGIATTSQITSPIQNVGLNSLVQITGLVTPASTGSAAPSGTMQFLMDGQAALWQAPVANGQSTLATNLTSAGSHTFTGIYLGDANYIASQSAPITLNVPARNFSLTVAGGIAIAAGTSGSTAITVTPVGGFTDQVSLACSLPSTMTGASCSFSPATVAGSGKANISVATTAPQTTTAHNRHGSLLAAITFPLGFLWLAVPARKRLALRLAMIACALASVFFISSCGGSSTPKPAPITSTPAGNYAVTVTGTSGTAASLITNQVQVVVNVQ